MRRYFFTYIMASRYHGTLYVGVTNNLIRRAAEHREGLAEGFTKRYAIKNLVYYEIFESPRETIAREKQIKPWRRAWKIQRIEASNPHWRDLAPNLQNELPLA